MFMKKDRIINPYIIKEIAALGHTEQICIADCGLPVPKGVPVVDVSVSAGVPGFVQVLEAVAQELVIESFTLAREITAANAPVEERVRQILEGIPCRTVPHEEFKRLVSSAKCVIRTGETSPYANVLLTGGVSF